MTTLHGTDITLVGKDVGFKPVVEHAIDASDGVTAVSDWLRRETYASFDVSAEIEVIPNFVDTERFARQPKDHFKRAIAPDGERLIAHVSNFRKVKRAPDVIEVFARLHAQGAWPEGHPRHGQPGGVKLLMVGDGPDRAASEALARQAGVWGDVRFIGQAGAGRGDPVHRRPVPDAVGVGDVRAGGAGGDGVRRAGRVERRGRPARAQRRRRDRLPAPARRRRRA